MEPSASSLLLPCQEFSKAKACQEGPAGIELLDLFVMMQATTSKTRFIPISM